MASPQISTKRVAISKANAQMVGVVAAAAFITVFCLFASQAIWSQSNYQSRVVDEKVKALRQLKENIASYSDLSRQYSAFNSTSTNVIGGINDGTGDNDGNNSKIILDALPSSYDFPALTSSLEKILKDGNLKVGSITGTDDQLNQGGSTTSTDPKAIAMPFTFSVGDANYPAIQQLMTKLERSIRPMQIDKLQISGGANSMTVTIDAHTYFQSGKNVSITKKVVK